MSNARCVDDATVEVDDASAEEVFDAMDTTVSFAIAVEMLRKRAWEESEEEDSAEEAELTVIGQVDGAADDTEPDDDDHYDWSCKFCDEQGGSMKGVFEHIGGSATETPVLYMVKMPSSVSAELDRTTTLCLIWWSTRHLSPWPSLFEEGFVSPELFPASSYFYPA